MIKKLKTIFTDVRDVCALIILTFFTVSVTALVLWAIVLFGATLATEFYRIAQ